MGNKKQIIVGAANIYLGPSGLTKPALTPGTKYRTSMAGANGSTSTGVGTLVTNWKDCGYTTDGLEVANEPEFSDVQVDQLLDAAKIFKTGMNFSLNTTFAEATLENLLISWGQTADTLSSAAPFENEAVVDAGQLGVAPVERGFIAIGNSPEHSGDNNYGERVYHVFRVLSVSGSTHSLSRNDPTVVPVSFRCLPEDSTGTYATIRDRLNV